MAHGMMTLGGSAEMLERDVHRVDANRTAVEKIGQLVEDRARGKIGRYQRGVGPFPAWEPPADSTVADRVRKGFSPNEPLLRTGEHIRDTIEHEVDKVGLSGGS